MILDFTSACNTHLITHLTMPDVSHVPAKSQYLISEIHIEWIKITHREN